MAKSQNVCFFCLKSGVYFNILRSRVDLHHAIRGYAIAKLEKFTIYETRVNLKEIAFSIINVCTEGMKKNRSKKYRLSFKVRIAFLEL